MKLIVAGSRSCPKEFAFDVLEVFEDTFSDEDVFNLEIVSGTARGADTWGEEWARILGHDIKQFPAEWEKYGRRAGILRNALMADYGDILIALWDGNSKGTKNMIETMLSHGKETHVYIFK